MSLKHKQNPTKAISRSMAIWRHNSFLGAVAMAQKSMEAIINSDTATPVTVMYAKYAQIAIEKVGRELRAGRMEPDGTISHPKV